MRRCSFSLCFGRQEAQAKFTPHVQHTSMNLRVTCPCLPQAVPALVLICTHPCVLPCYEHRLCSSRKSFPKQARTGSQSPMLYTPRPSHPRTALPGGVAVLLCRWQPRGPESRSHTLKIAEGVVARPASGSHRSPSTRLGLRLDPGLGESPGGRTTCWTHRKQRNKGRYLLMEWNQGLRGCPLL